jgi:hypothetical protein
MAEASSSWGFQTLCRYDDTKCRIWIGVVGFIGGIGVIELIE